MRDELVTRTVAALIEDAERLGEVRWDHVVSVTARRELDTEEVGAVLAELARHGIVVDLDAGVRADGTDGRPASTALSRLPTEMRRHRVLTASEEVALGRRIQLGLEAAARVTGEEGTDSGRELVQDGIRAREELVRSNLRLVASVAQRYVPSAGDLDFDDLVQEGTLGLQRAAEKFDPELGYKFSTYATWWIRQAICRGIDTSGHPIRLPVHIWERIRKINSYARSFEARNGRVASLREVAEGVDMDTGEVQALLDISRPLARLDAPVGDAKEGLTLGEMLFNSSLPDPDEAVERSSVSREVGAVIQSRLDPRSVDILDRRFGLSAPEPATLEEIARVYGLTRERIRQIEQRVLTILSDDRAIRALATEWGLRPQPKSPASRSKATLMSVDAVERSNDPASQESA